MAFLNTQSNKVPKENKTGLFGNGKMGLGYASNLALQTKWKPQGGVPGVNMSVDIPAQNTQKTPTTQNTQSNYSITKPPASSSQGYSVPSNTPRTGMLSTGAPKPLLNTFQTSPQARGQAYEQSGQMTDWERAAAENVAKAKGMENFGRFAPNAEAPFYAGAGQKQMETLITRPDLVGRAGSQEDLYGKFANLYGSQSNIGLQAAQAAAERNAGVQGNLFAASMPKSISPTDSLYNPLEGSYSAGGQGDRLVRAATAQGLQDTVKQYTQMSPMFSQISSLEGLVANKMTNAHLNPSDINKFNQFVQTLASNTSDPDYAQFQTYLKSLAGKYSQYIAGGGTVTDQVREGVGHILDGTASADTIAKTLEALRNEANAVKSSYTDLIQNQQGALNQGQGYVPTGSHSTGGSTGGNYQDSFSAWGY